MASKTVQLLCTTRCNSGGKSSGRLRSNSDSDARRGYPEIFDIDSEEEEDDDDSDDDFEEQVEEADSDFSFDLRQECREVSVDYRVEFRQSCSKSHSVPGVAINSIASATSSEHRRRRGRPRKEERMVADVIVKSSDKNFCEGMKESPAEETNTHSSRNQRPECRNASAEYSVLGSKSASSPAGAINLSCLATSYEHRRRRGRPPKGERMIRDAGDKSSPRNACEANNDLTEKSSLSEATALIPTDNSSCRDECSVTGMKRDHFATAAAGTEADVVIPTEALERLAPTEKGSLSNANRESSCVARRTRSHSCSSFQKLGTFSHPVDLDSEEERVVVEDEHLANTSSPEVAQDGDFRKEDDGGMRNNHVPFTEDNDLHQERRKKLREWKIKTHIGKSNKRKRVGTLKDDSFFKVLTKKIWDSAKQPPEKLKPTGGFVFKLGRNAEPHKVVPLPLKFSLAEPPLLKEKSESEVMMDQLWTQFDFALRSCQMGSFDSEVDSEEASVPESEIQKSTLCNDGKHSCFLDEKVGVRCSFCGFVELEIKHFLPSVVSRPWGDYRKKRTSEREDIMVFEGLDFQEKDANPLDHIPSGTVWDIIPGTWTSMYPHQREGFEFMWKNLAGGISLEELRNSAYSEAISDAIGGCVISHAPGTGKTHTTIAFLKSFMELFPECRPLIITPRSMLLPWKREFEKWKFNVPFYILNKAKFSGDEDDRAMNLYYNCRHRSQNSARLVKLYSWNKGMGILGISYALFQKLVVKIGDPKDKQSAEIANVLLERPGLLVLDEGHTPRNRRSKIWKALVKMKTVRRVILSGTLFQNNFEELYNILCLVRPKFAYSLSSKENIVPKKEWTTLTSLVGKASHGTLEEFWSILCPFVHVYKGCILKVLPGLRDCLLVLHPLPHQKRVLQSIQDLHPESFLAMECTVSLISVHPSLATACPLSEKEKLMLDQDLLDRIRDDPNEGVKTKFVMELIRLSAVLNEKVLVFSQYIEPLELIKCHLKYHFRWTEEREILQIDGNINMKCRHSSIDLFNDVSSEVRVLLASTKACCEGINLIGASRIILLDVVWNPSVERQAISRAYRLGQKKVVYAYHLITAGTTDERRYNIQAEKERLSKLIFSPAVGYTDKDCHLPNSFEDKILDEMVNCKELKGIFSKIFFQPKEPNLLADPGLHTV